MISNIATNDHSFTSVDHSFKDIRQSAYWLLWSQHYSAAIWDLSWEQIQIKAQSMRYEKKLVQLDHQCSHLSPVLPKSAHYLDPTTTSNECLYIDFVMEIGSCMSELYVCQWTWAQAEAGCCFKVPAPRLPQIRKPSPPNPVQIHKQSASLLPQIR